MNLSGKKTFEHNGETYEVRYAQVDGIIKVKAFKNDGSPADPYEFSVSTENQHDAETTQNTVNPFEVLVQTAEDYVRNNTWGQYLESLRELEESSN